ncbi:hypothetical protein C8R43DRAFT_875971 [Mycena crocata]|nr:hypothetical protein C8R43DRAFT_875971 [Mycena crocata]
MVGPLLQFRSSVASNPELPSYLEGVCNHTPTIHNTVNNIKCLWDHSKCFWVFTTAALIFSVEITHLTVATCPDCEEVHSVLLKNGLFPCSPTKPQTAISVQMLSGWQKMQETNTVSITGLAAGLMAHYTDEASTSPDVHTPQATTKDPFRQQITNAMQWFGNLCAHIDGRAESFLRRFFLETGALEIPVTLDSADEELITDNADPVAIDACPCCFNLKRWGRKDGDIHVGIDGNQTQKHNTRGGDGPTGHVPQFFLSKEDVDEQGERIENIRSGGKLRYKPDVPDEVIDRCAKSYSASNEKEGKKIPEKFDETGIFHLTCRHGIPLYLTSMTTAGEQSKYFVTLLLKLFTVIPSSATLVLYSDVACIIERALKTFPLLSPAQSERIRVSLNILHSLHHEYLCKMLHSPLVQRGLGLTDGEFVERLLSALRNCITVTRGQWAERRISTLEKQLRYIHRKERNSLGDWLQRRRDRIQKEIDEATTVLRECGLPIEQLREEWCLEQEAAHAANDGDDAKNLASINILLDLQVAVDSLNKKVNRALGKTKLATKSLVKKIGTLLEQVTSLIDDMHASQAEQLSPTLAGTTLDSMRTLLLARSVKIVIRKLAAKSFAKFEQVDKAKAGRGPSLGTKRNTVVLNSIKDGAPQLIAAIEKYNALCVVIASAPAMPNFTLPTPLPTKLSDLRSDPNLLQDVWINSAPRALRDPNIRKGIDAMLKVDRCIEEQARLSLEAANLVDWYEKRRVAVLRALIAPEGLPHRSSAVHF